VSVTGIRRPCLAALLAVGAALATAPPGAAGLHYKASTRTHDPAGRASEVQVEGWVDGPKARIDFVDASGSGGAGGAGGGMPFAQKGSWLLTLDGGKTLYLVDPQEKTYAKWSVDGMVAMVGALMNGLGPLLKIEISNPKVEKLADEDGGEVAGHATRHRKLRTTYEMKVRVIGIGSSSEVVVDEDLWTTTQWSDLGLGVWLRADPPRSGNAQIDKLIAAQREAIDGLPLKRVVVSTTTQKKGSRQNVSRSTTEVTELKKAAVPESTFDLPTGYSEVAAPSAQQPTEEEGGGLGGLFKKRKPPGGD